MMIPTRCGICKSTIGNVLWCEDHLQPEHAVCHARLLRQEGRFRKKIGKKFVFWNKMKKVV
jgi:hypothetical protein